MDACELFRVPNLPLLIRKRTPRGPYFVYLALTPLFDLALAALFVPRSLGSRPARRALPAETEVESVSMQKWNLRELR